MPIRYTSHPISSGWPPSTSSSPSSRVAAALYSAAAPSAAPPTTAVFRHRIAVVASLVRHVRHHSRPLAAHLTHERAARRKLTAAPLRALTHERPARNHVAAGPSVEHWRTFRYSEWDT